MINKRSMRQTTDQIVGHGIEQAILASVLVYFYFPRNISFIFIKALLKLAFILTGFIHIRTIFCNHCAHFLRW